MLLSFVFRNFAENYKAMRILQSSIVRAICAIVVGYLLVIYRTEMVQWLTIATGALFFISGLISVIAYYAEKRKAMKTAERLAAMAEMRDGNDAPENPEDIERAIMPSFPIVGLGSMILGVILALMPTTFVSGMMYEKPLFCCIPVFAGKCLISSALAYLTTSMIFRMAYVDCQFLTELLDAFFLLILRVISMFVPRKSLCTNKMPPFFLRSKSYACRMISLLTL